MTLSASISSATFIVPSSAVMAEPERPMTMTAVMSGPISRRMEKATRLATRSVAPSLANCPAPWMASTMPSRKFASATVGIEATPMFTIWSKSAESRQPRRPKRGAKMAREGPQGQLCVIEQHGRAPLLPRYDFERGQRGGDVGMEGENLLQAHDLEDILHAGTERRPAPACL